MQNQILGFLANAGCVNLSKIPALYAPGVLALCYASLLNTVKHILMLNIKKIHANIPALFNQCLLSAMTVYLPCHPHKISVRCEYMQCNAYS